MKSLKPPPPTDVERGWVNTSKLKHMTPKEKGKELVEWFTDYTVVETLHTPDGKMKQLYSDAKKCATKVVDEILLHEKQNHSVLDKSTDYWEEVKKEIEKK